MHPPNCPELAHSSIHERIASLPFLPAFKARRIVAPGKSSKFPAQRLRWSVGEMKQEMICELPPTKFSEKFALFHSRSLARVPDLPRPDLPKMEMRRQT